MSAPNRGNDLHPFQQAAVQAISDALDKRKRYILVELPVGVGRTRILRATLSLDVFSKSAVLVLVHTTYEKAQLLHALDLPEENLDKRSVLGRRVIVKTIAELPRLDSRGVFLSEAGVIITLGFSIGDESVKQAGGRSINTNGVSCILSFVTSATNIDAVYDSPVFSYSLNEAVQDGILIPVQYHSCPKLPPAVFTDSIKLAAALKPFIKHLSSNPGKKVIMFCPSREDGEILRRSLEGLRLQANIIADEVAAALAWNTFTAEGRKATYIMISGRANLIGFDIPYMTDVVLLRSIREKTSFENILSRLMRKTDDKRSSDFWDFGDNQKYFDSSLGQVISEIYENYPVDADKSENKDENASRAVLQFIAPVGDNVSKEDLLGRARLLHVLKGLIRDTRSARNFRPFVVGLFGKWGAGKSTVVYLLQKEFDNDKQFTFVSFNAWQNEHCTHMGAALAHQVVAQLYQKKSAAKRLLLALKHNIFLKRDDIAIGLLGAGFLSLVAALSVKVDQVANFIQDERWPSILRGNSFLSFFIVFLVLTAAALFKTYLEHPFTDKIKKVVAKPDYSAHLGIAEQIKEEIGALFKAHALQVLDLWKKERPSRQFVVVIDDLDRCSDSKIVEVLEAIRLIIDVPNVVVILTVDQSILISAVANKYCLQNNKLSWEQALSVARDFLGKIIQISIELDTPDISQTKHFVSKRLYTDAIDIETIHKHIVESRGLNMAESKTADDVKKMLEPSLKELFDEAPQVKEVLSEDIETSSDYLKSTANEAETYSRCVGAFEIGNPRTLVRIHNTVTLLKGLHPELVADKKSLDLHIYLAFLQESYAMKTGPEQSMLEGLLNDSFDNQRVGLMNMRRLADELEIRANKNNIRAAASRIRRLSLPSVNNLVGEQK